LASTPRYRKDGQWADRPTEWFTVKAWRDAALNIALSVHKGEPVIVQGRLRSQEWTSADGPRTDHVIEAFAVGHDLMRGRASFTRVVRNSQERGREVSADDGQGDDDAGPDADDVFDRVEDPVAEAVPVG